MIKTAIGGALVGALLMSRVVPKTKCEKKKLLGPKSGATYSVEDFVDTGFVVVKAEDGAMGIFSKKKDGPGYDWHQGRGRPSTLAQIYEDMIGEKPRPRAVPEQRPASKPTTQNRSDRADSGKTTR